MTAWSIAAGLLGVMVGVFGKYLADLRAGRTNRLLDEKLKHAVKFLETADKLRRASQSRMHAIMSLDNARHGDQEVYRQLHAQHEERVQEAVEVFADAEDAYNALRLLVPTAAGPARRYLDLCNSADPHPDKDREARERARQTAEGSIRSALGV